MEIGDVASYRSACMGLSNVFFIRKKRHLRPLPLLLCSSWAEVSRKQIFSKKKKKKKRCIISPLPLFIAYIYRRKQEVSFGNQPKINLKIPIKRSREFWPWISPLPFFIIYIHKRKQEGEENFRLLWKNSRNYFFSESFQENKSLIYQQHPRKEIVNKINLKIVPVPSRVAERGRVVWK